MLIFHGTANCKAMQTLLYSLIVFVFLIQGCEGLARGDLYAHQYEGLIKKARLKGRIK